jgi:DNA-binding NarL/FixJ family response regulator
MKELIKIGVVDDHALFRRLFIQTLTLNSNFSVILEAENGADLLEKLGKVIPDVLLLDVKMPKLDGIESLKILSEKFPAIRILILSAFMDEVYVAKTIECGVSGYLTKSMDFSEISTAIETAFVNKIYTTNLLINSILKSYILKFNRDHGHVLPVFSEDEIQMLNYLRDEMSTKEIADRMYIGQRTVEIKRDKMRKKANVKTIAGLLIYAIKRGLIALEKEVDL